MFLIFRKKTYTNNDSFIFSSNTTNICHESKTRLDRKLFNESNRILIEDFLMRNSQTSEVHDFVHQQNSNLWNYVTSLCTTNPKT